MAMEYVMGLAHHGNTVLLSRKMHTTENTDFLNGISGKVERGEDIRGAMVRSFYKETDIVTEPKDWRYFANVHSNKLKTYWFKMQFPFDVLEKVVRDRVSSKNSLYLFGVYGMVTGTNLIPWKPSRGLKTIITLGLIDNSEDEFFAFLTDLSK